MARTSREGRLRGPDARAKVGELQARVHIVTRLDQHVLGLDVAVKDAPGVHVIDRPHHLPRINAHKLRIEVPLPPPDELIEIKLHELKDEGEPGGRTSTFSSGSSAQHSGIRTCQSVCRTAPHAKSQRSGGGSIS